MAKSRASAATVVIGEARGALAQGIEQLRAAVERDDLVPAAGEVERDAPGARRRRRAPASPRGRPARATAAGRGRSRRTRCRARGPRLTRRTSRGCTAPRGDEQVAQREHRGVGGQGEERAVAAAQGAVQAGSELGLDGDPVGRDAGVLQAQRHLGGAGAAARRAPHAGREDLEVRVPHPADVAPVGDVVVEHGEDVVLAVLQRERAQDLVGARRVLDQQDRHVALGDAQRLGAPEGGGDGVQAGVDVVERRAEGEREGGGAEGVVDVVEPGQGQRDRARARPACAA